MKTASLVEPQVEQRECTEHGVYTSRRWLGRIWSKCPGCAAEQERQEADRQREAEREGRRRLMMQSCGLEGRYLQAEFAAFRVGSADQRKVLTACQTFGTQPTEGWAPRILVGPPGTGKTHLLSAMVLGSIGAGRSAHITTARALIRRLRDTWNRSAAESETRVLAELGSVGLLCIDEVGTTFGTESEQVQLLEVIDRRYQNNRATAFASNLPVPALRAVLGDRIFDRLREGSIVLPCDWESYRGRQGESR